jgi:hypothetical protein
MSDDTKVVIPTLPELEFTRSDGTVLFKASCLKINGMISQASSGLEKTQPDYSNLQFTRLAYALSEEFGVTISPDEAYVIGSVVVKRLQEVKNSF